MLVFLGMGYLIQDIFQFHPFAFKFPDVIIFNGWVILHCVQIPKYLYPFIGWGASRLFQILLLAFCSDQIKSQFLFRFQGLKIGARKPYHKGYVRE